MYKKTWWQKVYFCSSDNSYSSIVGIWEFGHVSVRKEAAASIVFSERLFFTLFYETKGSKKLKTS